MTPEKEKEIGDRTHRFLVSGEWREAWDAYRDLLLSKIEETDDPKVIGECKALLKAANRAKAHLEQLVTFGKIAAKDIEIIEKRSLLKKLGLY